jgi:two-component system alkaline phosphatase synthesis response regulator PhoP
MFSAMLDIMGFNPVATSGGEEALAILATQRADVILLDYMMPGMNGIEFFKKVRAANETAAIPVIMVTARQDIDAMKEAHAAGVDFFKTKPIGFEQLEKILQFALYPFVETAQIAYAERKS